MNKLLERLKQTYESIEDALSELPNYGGECHEDHEGTVQIIHNGDFDEIHTFCTECGGYKV
jgi:hypothetical protein